MINTELYFEVECYSSSPDTSRLATFTVPKTQAARDMSWTYLLSGRYYDIQGQNIAYVMDNEMYNDVLAYTRASESVILLLFVLF